jgi:ATP synthase protein I
MNQDDEPDKLRDLGARIDKARAGRPPASRNSGKQGDTGSGMALGLRIGLELVVAVAVGVGAGLLLDRWLGTAPWGMVGCFFAGVAAGMVNVFRTVTGLGMAAGYRKTDTRSPRASDDSWDED